MVGVCGDPTREIQRALYRSAKQHPKRKYRHLYETMCRPDILDRAYREAEANEGSPGVDGLTFDMIEGGSTGVAGFLEALRSDLEEGTYRPQPVRRVYIPKPQGGERPLGIPCIRDRVVQTAAKIVLEPIFEARFLPCSYGFRPQRSALEALEEIRSTVNQGYHHVVDADIRGFFNELNQEKLLWLVDEHVWDPRMRKLIGTCLRAGALDHGQWQASDRGTPQGGPLSPLLANLYLHYLDRVWARRGGQYGKLVRYADDFVILCRTPGAAATALAEVHRIMSRLDLELNEEKTRIVALGDGEQSFDFLGFTLRRVESHQYKGRHYLQRWPSRKKLKALYAKVREEIGGRAHLYMSLEDAVGRINAILRGWGAYFRWGNSTAVFAKVDDYVRMMFCLFLSHKRGKSGRRWSTTGGNHGVAELLREAGLYRLVGTVRYWAPAIAQR